MSLDKNSLKRSIKNLLDSMLPPEEGWSEDSTPYDDDYYCENIASIVKSFIESMSLSTNDVMGAVTGGTFAKGTGSGVVTADTSSLEALLKEASSKMRPPAGGWKEQDVIADKLPKAFSDGLKASVSASSASFSTIQGKLTTPQGSTSDYTGTGVGNFSYTESPDNTLTEQFTSVHNDMLPPSGGWAEDSEPKTTEWLATQYADIIYECVSSWSCTVTGTTTIEGASGTGTIS